MQPLKTAHKVRENGTFENNLGCMCAMLLSYRLKAEEISAPVLLVHISLFQLSAQHRHAGRLPVS